jgi:hypothetical protein
MAKASCDPEESLVGDGFWVTGLDHAAPIYSHGESFFSQDTKTWAAETVFDHDGSITTYAVCLKVELALKE